MNKFNHKHIDLLKLDIEGAEIKVLEQMFNDNIYPKYFKSLWIYSLILLFNLFLTIVIFY